MERGNGQVLDAMEYRRLVLGLAKDHLDQMVTTLLDAVLFLPGYTSDFRPAPMADVRSSVRYTAEHFLEALIEERSLSEQELVSLTIIGGRRAHLPREVLMAAIAAACDAGLDFLLDMARKVPAPSPVALAAVQWFRTALARLRQDATDAMRSGQANEQERKPQTLAQRRIWLVDRLLHGLWDDPEELGREALSLGCELSPPFGLLLVTAADGTDLDGLRVAATALAERLPTAVEGPARPFPSGRHAVVLLPRLSDGHQVAPVVLLDEEARELSLYVLCPEPAQSIVGLPAVYNRTTRDLSLPARVRLPPGVVNADDLAYYRLITRAAPEELVDFAERFVGPILRSKWADQLVRTLEALYRSDGVPSAATAIDVHENTVYQRIRRTTELTGCDLRIPAEAARVFTGLRLRFAIHPDALGQERSSRLDG